MKTYPFCSIALQQSFEILRILQYKFVPEDMNVMIEFIISNLSKNNLTFKFGSGRTTSSLNKGQLMHIAIELKQLLNQRGIELPQWKQFEKDIMNEEEEKWNRKLEKGREETQIPIGEDVIELHLDDEGQEDFNKEDAIQEELKENEENNENELAIKDILNQVKNKTRMGTKTRQQSMGNKKSPRLVEKNEIQKKVKDDWDYLDNNFWKLPDSYNIDDLMADLQ